MKVTWNFASCDYELEENANTSKQGHTFCSVIGTSLTLKTRSPASSVQAVTLERLGLEPEDSYCVDFRSPSSS
jgi:hypothetical protein